MTERRRFNSAERITMYLSADGKCCECKRASEYILGNKTQRKQRRALLKFPVLPYPKPTRESRGDG